MKVRSKLGGNHSTPRGFSLIEVLVAVVVLSVGLLALAALQGQLVRGGSSAKAQTQAMALAQQKLEEFRGFKTASGSLGDSYEVIADGSDASPIQIGANSYTRSWKVDRYAYAANNGASGGSFKPSTSVTVGKNEFKQVTVTTSWTNETGQLSQVQVGDVISVAAPGDSLSALASPVAGTQGPKVYIDPSKFAPGVIPIALGNSQSAAASDPQPESFSTGHITTRFSVQDYSTSATSNGYDLLNKQFDFALTSCTCNVAGNSTSASPAYGPTYWNGTQYVAPSTMVGKPTGTDPVSNGNPNNSSQDPILCSACCRDHHDMAGSSSQPYPVTFDPFRPSSEYSGNDHKHYDTNNSNVLQTSVVTASGDEYYETCRFVRVDGINYVSTDARQENHILVAPVPPITISTVSIKCDPTGDSISGNTTCQDHALDTTTSGTTYPNFVKDYVTAFYAAWQTAVAAGTYPIPANSVTPGVGDLLVNSNGTPTTLATTYASLINAPTQTILSLAKSSIEYMEGRGVYIDYISTETKNALACIGQTSNINCAAYANLAALQILPFVAVNQTNLDRWGPAGNNAKIISVTDASIPTGGTYDPFVIGYTFDRGTVTGVDAGSDVATAQARPGNAGLIDSLTVSPSYPFEAYNCVGPANVSQVPCSADPPDSGSGFSYDTSGASGTRFQTDSQPYTITTGGGTTYATFFASYVDHSSGKSNIGSIALSVTAPALTPSTLQNCTLGNGNKQPYTCTSTSTDTSIALQFTGYNSQISCNGKNCPSPPAVNDYKICSISGLSGNVVATIGAVVNAGCYNSGNPVGCTGVEQTPVTLAITGNVAAALSTLSLTANFYPEATACP